MGMAIAALIVATIAFGLFVGPIGITGLFLVVGRDPGHPDLFSVWPGEPKRVAYYEQLPTRTVVRQLDGLLVRERTALPAPAARGSTRSAASSLLESRLAEVDPLDPLAQDARRLMGKHLPDLIERYERVPADYRQRARRRGADRRRAPRRQPRRGAPGPGRDRRRSSPRATARRSRPRADSSRAATRIRDTEA